MRKLILCVMVCCLALLAGSLAQAQDRVLYRDRAKKDAPETEQNGSIKSESPDKIVVKPTIGPDKNIPAGDIIDVVYELKGPDKAAYTRAWTAERTATAPSSKLKPGSAQYNSALDTALKGYQALTLSGPPQRHLEYKIATLTAKMAGDDKALMNKAIALLAAFKKNHATSWQISPCINSLAQLYVDTNDFEKAAGLYDEMKKMAGVSDEFKLNCDLTVADLFIKAKKHTEAAARLEAVLPKTPAKDRELLETKLIICKANSPVKFKEAIEDLRKKIAAAKDPDKTAMYYNTLGDCYMLNNEPKNAVYEYLFVDLVYNQNKSQHKNAVEKLSQVFKDLKQPDRAKEYADKFERMK
jgi:pentatricopeptide repeat protein